MFESLVNLEGCKTKERMILTLHMFESLVNLEGCKTSPVRVLTVHQFESLVNLEGCKTEGTGEDAGTRLRVLLI